MTSGRKLAIGAVALAIVGAGFFWAWKPAPPPPPRPAPPAPKAALPTTPKTALRTFPAVLSAQHTVSVDAHAYGLLDAFLADVGQAVTEGQLLARFSTADLENARDQAESAAEQSQNKVNVAETSLQSARLELQKRQADAKRAQQHVADAGKAYERQRALNEVGATPRKLFEQAAEQWETAKKEYAALAETVRGAENLVYRETDELKAAQQAVVESRKKADATRTSFATAEVHAPVAGLLVARNVEPGQQIGPENAKGLFEIATDISFLRASFEVNSVEEVSMRVGERVEVHAGDVTMSAVISSVEEGTVAADFESRNPALRPGSPCTVTVQIK